MNCKISCSFGEIVDKVTILKIKEKKATDEEALCNIKKELRIIQIENPMVKEDDDLFNQLSFINNKLWILEDLIREKSKKKQFDEQYLNCAESIHITNDQRYQVKRQINEKYNSNLKEEKVYKKSDLEKLEIGKMAFTNGQYNKSRDIIENIMRKYKKSYSVSKNLKNSFFIDLLFSYNNICMMFSLDNPYFKVMIKIMSKIDKIKIPNVQKEFCKTMFCTSCLYYKRYREAYPFLGYINYINAPGVNYKDMSFFIEGDTSERTLLLYDGGGIGDKLMLSRFIPILCTKWPEKKFIFVVNDKIQWIFNDIFKKYTNFSIKDKDKEPIFDYHCNLLSLIKYLKYEHDTIPFSPIFKEIKCPDTKILIKGDYYVFNWKGNVNNPHEKHNRSMSIKNAIPLFSYNKKIVKWVVITKDINEEESNILREHNVLYLGDIIDKDKSFYDSISILRNSKGLISTDTSLVHLSALLDVPTYVMLTLGSEWRWKCSSGKNIWYPNIKIFSQDKIKEWGGVIENVCKMI